jgi:hypothetical protein
LLRNYIETTWKNTPWIRQQYKKTNVVRIIYFWFFIGPLHHINFNNFLINVWAQSETDLLRTRVDDLSTILGRGRKFSLRHEVQTYSGAYPSSCRVGTEGFLPGS